MLFNTQKRDAAGPNEIVACTTCGGTSPCTHSANNGCATEVGLKTSNALCGIYILTIFRTTDLFRASAQERATPSDPGGQDHRRDSANHFSDGVLNIPHFLLHPLQGLLVSVGRSTNIVDQRFRFFKKKVLFEISRL